MTKRILSIVLAMLMILPLVFSFTSCEKERTEEEIINDIVNSGTTALTLSVWIPTNSDASSQEFKDRLSEVENKINEILRDKNLSTEIEFTAVSNDEYEEKLSAYLADIEAKVEAKKGLLPSSVSQGYVNKAIKIPYGDSYMYELAYPSVLDTQIDLFMIRDYDSYKALVQAQNLYALDSYLAVGGKYADIRKMISPAIFSQYLIDNSTYAIPNNHQYTDAKYQYMLIDKNAFNLVENADINSITDIFTCEAFINSIGANAESGYVPFVGSLNDAPGVYMFDESELIGSSLANITPSSIFNVEAYTKYVELYKKLLESSYAKETLNEGEKAAVSFFYGTNDEIKAYEEEYYVVKTEKPIANSDEIFSSMFAVSKYSANYDRAMKILYLLQTDVDIITLLQYGVENVDYTLEIDNDGNEIIEAAKDGSYNMSGLNIGNSYLTYKEYGATIDNWDDVKASNYDLVVNPYLNFLKNFNENATDEEKEQLSTLTSSVKVLSDEVSELISAMTSEEFIAFLELLKIDVSALDKEIADYEAKLAEEQAKEEPDSEKIAEIQEMLNAAAAKKALYDANTAVVSINSSEDYKSLIALYNDLLNKYN